MGKKSVRVVIFHLKMLRQKYNEHCGFLLLKLNILCTIFCKRKSRPTGINGLIPTEIGNINFALIHYLCSLL